MTTKILATFVLGALLGVIPALAQRPLEFNVPFDFSIGAQSWSAGKYVVTFPHQSVLLIRTRDHKKGTFVMTNAAQSSTSSEPSRLVFNRYGEKHFLSKIWMPYSNDGRVLNKSKTETEIAAQITGGSTILSASR